MNYSSFTRPRKPLNKVSKKARRKIKVVREAKKQLFLENKIYCAVCSSDEVTPAHRLKQRNIKNDVERSVITPLCKDHHFMFEILGQTRNSAILTFINECLEFDRAIPNFREFSEKDLKAFADKLILETTDI